MIKVITTLLLITSAKVLFAQGIVQNQLSILYRGFENKVELGSVNGDSTLRLAGEDVIIKKKFNHWIVKPVQGYKRATLFALNKSGDTLNKTVFTIRSLPKLTLYIGRFESGEKITNFQERKLMVKMPFQCMIQPETKINNWKIEIEGEELISGNGDFLFEDAISKLTNLKIDTVITITCNYSINEELKTISGVFKLNL
jgi:hypothetical protein